MRGVYQSPLPESVNWGVLIACAVLPLLCLLWTLGWMGWQRWGHMAPFAGSAGLVSGDTAAELKGRSGKYDPAMRERDQAEAQSIKARVGTPPKGKGASMV